MAFERYEPAPIHVVAMVVERLARSTPSTIYFICSVYFTTTVFLIQ